ncbi:cytochrome P450 [Micromonospora parva]|uniref:cytochrome P450 n=1 Tax=Micromonospora parva TaxID=1464048 RepID=UPI0033FC260B
MTTGYADLTDTELFTTGRHLGVLRALRDEQPVYWNPTADGSGFWALSRYADVLWAYREHSIFGSERGAVLGGSFRSVDDTAGGRMLVATDLPRHRLLKQAIHPALSAGVVARIGERVRELVGRAVDRAIVAGGADFATDIATEMPAAALMEVMGIGYGDAHHLIGLTRRMVGFRDETFVDIGGEQGLRLAWLQAEIFEFFADQLAARWRRPGDDLISRLLSAEINGRRLSEEDIFYNCMNVAVGGNETSSYTSCSGLLALIEHPGEYDRLQTDPTLLPGALEEMLRWGSTNAYVQRVAKQDVERAGALIRRGDSVTLWNVSANHDETQFPEPERFNVTRSPNRHLSYGAGIHRCIGAPAAQLELSLLFQRLLVPGLRWRLAAEPRRLRSNFILGITSLPVEVV